MKKIVSVLILAVIVLTLFVSCHECAVCGKSKLITSKKTFLGKDIYICNSCKNAPENALNDIKDGAKKLTTEIKDEATKLTNDIKDGATKLTEEVKNIFK